MPRITVLAVGAFLGLLACNFAQAETAGVPPNDECVDAIPFDTGTCKVSGAVCGKNADCSTSTCSYDGTDCTADPGLCVNQDLC